MEATNIQTTIIRHEIGGSDQQAVDARALHAFLEVGKKFADWISDRIGQYGFVEGIDYVKTEGLSVPESESSKARPQKTIEYAITTDMAKELAMVERNAKGKEARLYFINMERQAKDLAALIPKSLPEALRYAAALQERAEQQEAKLKELAPKAQFCDRVANQVDSQNINEVAKVLGTGEVRLWRWLKEKKYVFKEGRSNVPYQQFIDSGYFKLKQGTYTDGNGDEHAYTRVLVTGKGLVWLQKKWDEDHGQEAA